MTLITVLTNKGTQQILDASGTSDWRLNVRTAENCEYCVCVQNRNKDHESWAKPEHNHHEAFLIGKISHIAPTYGERYKIVFSEYAKIKVANKWDGNRNPVSYRFTLNDFEIENINELDWQPMPKIRSISSGKEAQTDDGLTIPEAKKRIASRLGISSDNIQIIITT